MRDTIRTCARYILIAILAFVIFIPTVVFLLTFILVSLIIVLITAIPGRLGGLIPVDSWARGLIHRYLDINRMQLFRDDMLRIFQRHAEIPDGVDRYWMLREMDAAAERIDTRLRNGEFVVAVFAGVTSIALAMFAQIQYAGVVLTVFAIGISTAAFIRVVIIDILAYEAAVYQEAPYEEVAARMGWNRGPINGRGAVLTALGTIVVGVNDAGYRLGKWILEEFVAERYRDNGDGVWESDS